MEEPVAPEFPIVSGTTRLNDEWNITLNNPFSRRVEDGCLVLWNSLLTIWFDQYGNDHGHSVQQRIEEWLGDVPAEAEGLERGLDRFSYSMQQEDGITTLNGFVFNEGGHLLIEMSMEEAGQLKAARTIFKSINAA